MERRRKVSRCVQVWICLLSRADILTFVRRSGESTPKTIYDIEFVLWYAENTSEMSDQDQVMESHPHEHNE